MWNRVTRYFGSEEGRNEAEEEGGSGGVALTIPGSIREGRREGGREGRTDEGGREAECLTHLPRPQLCRTNARTHADGRTDGRGRGIKRLGEGFPMFRILPSGGGGGDADGLIPLFESVIPKAVDIRPDPGAAAAKRAEERGVGNLSRSPRPGILRERLFGELVFPGVQLLDRGHWVPQRLPQAGRRHHARAPRRYLGGRRRPGLLLWRRLTSRH